ncbi:MAG: flavodoxin [Clostridiales Family XIII bacterium]|jgi:flavodoxin|nr:flavodoxin [Clostridiales Family XIII bacterium]
MKTEVRYYTRSGNAKKLAEAIAGVIGAAAETVETPLSEPVDLLFLGGAVYAGNLDSHLKSFAAGLTADKAKAVAVFNSAAGGRSIRPDVAALITDEGIRICEEAFSCKGKFLLANRGKPDAQDCAGAAAFAKKLIGEFAGE